MNTEIYHLDLARERKAHRQTQERLDDALKLIKLLQEPHPLDRYKGKVAKQNAGVDPHSLCIGENCLMLNEDCKKGKV